MIRSMTGYGRAEGLYGDKNILIEIRSLNSKFLDVSVRSPQVYREKELDIRNEINRGLHRGKIDITLHIDNFNESSKFSVNRSLIKSYYKELKMLAEDLNLKVENVLPILMDLPNAIKPEEEGLDEKEWKTIHEVLKKAIVELNAFRLKEGKELEAEFKRNIQKIISCFKNVMKQDKERRKILKERLKSQIAEAVEEHEIDKNRLEQEIIYYLEKLDITEEIVRLESHCKFFTDVLKNKEEVKGKKLNFISQEMGREINTIGSKANDARIQTLVVEMKDELEKIKEQVNNVL